MVKVRASEGVVSASPQLRRALFWVLPVALFGGAIAKVCAVPPLPALGEGDEAAHRRVAQAVREAEAGFRRDSLQTFPGDPWSQGDQFAAQERTLVERLSGDEQLRPGVVFDAIDRDIKRGEPGARERGWVPPCMPRPFYD
jgi:hypothetical protein